MLPITRTLARECTKAAKLLSRSYDSGAALAAKLEAAELRQPMLTTLVAARYTLANHWYPTLVLIRKRES